MPLRHCNSHYENFDTRAMVTQIRKKILIIFLISYNLKITMLVYIQMFIQIQISNYKLKFILLVHHSQNDLLLIVIMGGFNVQVGGNINNFEHIMGKY